MRPGSAGSIRRRRSRSPCPDFFFIVSMNSWQRVDLQRGMDRPHQRLARDENDRHQILLVVAVHLQDLRRARDVVVGEQHVVAVGRALRDRSRSRSCRRRRSGSRSPPAGRSRATLFRRSAAPGSRCRRRPPASRRRGSASTDRLATRPDARRPEQRARRRQATGTDGGRWSLASSQDRAIMRPVMDRSLLASYPARSQPEGRDYEASERSVIAPNA